MLDIWVSMRDSLIAIKNRMDGIYNEEANDFEPLTVSSNVVPLNISKVNGENHCYITVETAAVRFRVDGPVPTATNGHLTNPGQIIVLESPREILNFRAIRATSVDATLMVTYSRRGY